MSIAKIIPPKAKFDPTDKSISPEIMRKLAPTATTPSSAAIVTMSPSVPELKKCFCNEKKTVNTIIKAQATPISR